MPTLNWNDPTQDPGYDNPGYYDQPGTAPQDPYAYRQPLTQAYQSALGRDPGAGEVDRWWNMLPGSVDERVRSLGQTQEAQNWATTRPQNTGGGGNAQALIRQWQQSHQASESLAGLIAHLKQHGVNADAFMYGATPSGNEITLDGTKYKVKTGDNSAWYDPSTNGESGAGAGYADPSSQLYLNELMSRMEALRQPVNDPLAPLYQLMTLQRLEKLQGDPYTAGDDAALRARYMTPLTQARDAELQQNRERISQRGMLPSSGLLDELNQGTNQHYQEGVAQGSNDLAVRAVDERQRRQMEGLNELSQLLNFQRTSRSEEDRRAAELIDLAGQFPAMDERRQAMLLNSSNDNSAAQATTSILSEASQQLQRDLQASHDQASKDAAWGAFFARVIAGLGK